jgi:hypothetical protein
VKTTQLLWKTAAGDPLATWEPGSPKAKVNLYEADCEQIRALLLALRELDELMQRSAEELAKLHLPMPLVKEGAC